MSEEACAGEQSLDYDTGLHVGAIFIIASLSFLGALLPILSFWYPSLRTPEKLLVAGNSFGCGVVIATGFIHMIPPAIAALNNPCLGRVADEYSALPSLIVMASLLGMQLIEFLVSRKITDEDVTCKTELPTVAGKGASVSETSTLTAPLANPTHEIEAHQPAAQTAMLGSQYSAQQSSNKKTQHTHHHHHHQLHHHVNADNTARGRSLVTLLIFEIGVAFHSVIIGVSLGVLGGSEFRTLLAALCFHQFFEGFALGTAIVGINPTKKTIINTLLAYVFSTPIGIAVGILIHTSYNADSANALWTQGVFDAVSAGTLLYAGIVELLTYGLTINPKYGAKVAKNSTVVAAFCGLYLGAGAMAVVGKWA